MIKIDLITGFLGSGKTTFIKKYAQHFLDKGLRVGILENDYGAVNVDVMLLSELEKAGCGIESVAGACDRDCHQRRFKTKLIALAMSGYDRVIIEPSGIFDIDEFFDSLHEEPLDRWYETGSVIAIADAGLEDELSEQSEYLLASQCADAGKIILSRTQETSSDRIHRTVEHIENAVRSIGCKRDISDSVITKAWNDLTANDMEEISKCGHVGESYVKKFRDCSGYGSLYFMNTKITAKEAENIVRAIFSDNQCGDVFRIKGFIPDGENWHELNATNNSISMTDTDNGQEIVIVIGENLNKEKISGYFMGE